MELRAAARRVAAVGEAHAERFARGVSPDPHSLVLWVNEPPEAMVQWANGKVPEGGRMSGLIFIDGSGLHPSQPLMRRAGWAVVQVDRFGNMQFGAYGPAPLAECPLQTSPEAEDYAAFMLTQLVIAPLEVYGDCEGALGSMKDSARGCDPAGCRSHLWRCFWAQVESDELISHKTLSHAVAADVHAGRTTEWERRANAAADCWAKAGARRYGIDKEGIAVVRVCHNIAKQAARWGGGLQANLSMRESRDCDDFDAPMEGLIVTVNRSKDCGANDPCVASTQSSMTGDVHNVAPVMMAIIRVVNYAYMFATKCLNFRNHVYIV